MLRALAVCLAIASFAPAPARGAEWRAGDVEAAERYRALERERALRYRAALEERAAQPGAEARQREPQRERERGARSGRAAGGDPSGQGLFEPWVERLAERALDALWGMLEDVGSRLWSDLRAWLDATLSAAFGDETRAAAARGGARR